MDFHRYRVPEECVMHLEKIYSSHSVREYFLKLQGCVMNDIEHNFIDTISTKKILR